MTHLARTDTRFRRTRLWVGLLGGGVAWMGHLLGAYGLAEFGCLTALVEMRWAGATAVWWAILAISVMFLALSAAATAWAWRAYRHADDNPTERSIACTGVITSGLFTFILVIQSLPLLFYVTHC